MKIQGETQTLSISNLGDFKKISRRSKGEACETDLTVPQPSNEMECEVSAFMKTVQSGQLECDLMPWSVSMEVMQVLDAARKDAGITFPNDSPPAEV